jgi:hypothetical protein
MIHYFQPQFVFDSPTNNHKQNKNYILDHLNTTIATQSDMGNATTTNGSIDLSPFTPEILDDIIWTPFELMLQELQVCTPTQSKLKSIWWNYYKPGQYTEPHKHVDCDFSGIYLLHLEEPNTTVFYQNGESPSFPLFDEYYNTTHIEEGSTIIFPGRLLHYAKPSLKDRYVVVFNIDTL